MYNLPQPVKFWTVGPCFRHERPQAGRYRQFTQFSLEVLGEKNPSIDGQIIQKERAKIHARREKFEELNRLIAND
jgi:histidyl-tRNA synthetase